MASLVVALVVGLLVIAAIVVLVTVLVRRPRSRGPSSYAVPGQPDPAVSGVRMDPTAAWQAVGPSLTAMGMTPLDAETHMCGVGAGQNLFLNFEVSDGSVRGWLDRPCPGGVFEQFIGTEAEINPGGDGRSDFAKIVAAGVREILGALPRGAHLRVKAPEIPGDNYKASLKTPFSSPDHASIVVRALLAVDQTAHRPAAPGAQARLPPVVMAWQAAGPSLQSMGLSKLGAETYMMGLGGGQDLFLSLDVGAGSLRGWLDRPCPGGVLEQFIGAEAELRPGDGGHSNLAKFVAASVRELLGALPHGARLVVKAPEIPGDSYKANVTTPFSSPEQASNVARVLLTLDQAAHMPASPGARMHLPPVVMAWQAAGPLLEAVGLRKLDAETYMRSFPGGQDLFVSLSVRDATVRGWVDRPCPGGVLERFLRAEIALQPGEAGRSEMAAWLANGLREGLGALPPAARLTVRAPEIPGDSYKASLTTPFSSPEHASNVARVLLMLDAAVQAR
jgi:hypothetical protein